MLNRCTFAPVSEENVMAKVKEMDVRGTRSGRLWLNTSIRFCRWRAQSAERKAAYHLKYEHSSSLYWIQVEGWWYERLEELEDIRIDLEQNHRELLAKDVRVPSFL